MQTNIQRSTQFGASRLSIYIATQTDGEVYVGLAGLGDQHQFQISTWNLNELKRLGEVVTEAVEEMERISG